MKEFCLGYHLDTVALMFAIFFTITYLEYLIRDLYAHDDTMADHMMVEKFSACLTWGAFYYLTH